LKGLLVDTSCWIDHLRQRDSSLSALLEDGLVWTHPYVIGELACGNLANRTEVLALLDTLPLVPVADHEEVLAFVESRRLMGRGLGWIDVHLLASAVLASLPLRTSDKRLSTAAHELGLEP
jgi:predicted nucleic acid-binding protein